MANSDGDDYVNGKDPRPLVEDDGPTVTDVTTTSDQAVVFTVEDESGIENASAAVTYISDYAPTDREAKLRSVNGDFQRESKTKATVTLPRRALFRGKEVAGLIVLNVTDAHANRLTALFRPSNGNLDAMESGPATETSGGLTGDKGAAGSALLFAAPAASSPPISIPLGAAVLLSLSVGIVALTQVTPEYT